MRPLVCMACLALAAASLGTACGSSRHDAPPPPPPRPVDAAPAVADRCQTFVDRSRPVLAEQRTEDGRPLGAAEYDELVAHCRRDALDADASALVACVVASGHEPAMRACWDRYLDRAFDFLRR